MAKDITLNSRAAHRLAHDYLVLACRNVGCDDSEVDDLVDEAWVERLLVGLSENESSLDYEFPYPNIF